MIEVNKSLRTKDGSAISPAWIGNGYCFEIKTNINVTNCKGDVERRESRFLLWLSDKELEELKTLMEEDKKERIENLT